MPSFNHNSHYLSCLIDGFKADLSTESQGTETSRMQLDEMSTPVPLIRGSHLRTTSYSACIPQAVLNYFNLQPYCYSLVLIPVRVFSNT